MPYALKGVSGWTLFGLAWSIAWFVFELVLVLAGGGVWAVAFAIFFGLFAVYDYTIARREHASWALTQELQQVYERNNTHS